MYKCALSLILCLTVINFSYSQDRPSRPLEEGSYAKDKQEASLGEDRIVAIVNHEVITQSEVEEVTVAFYEQLSSNYSDKKIEEELVNMQEVALNRLIEDKLILEEAKRQEILMHEEAIDQRIDQMKTAFDTEFEFQEALNARDITVPDLRKKIKEQLMMSAAVEINVKNGISVSPVEITAYYYAHLDEFKAPESVEVDSIFCDSLEEAREALSLLKQGKDFKEVEKEKSSGVSFGVVKKGELRKDIEDAIFRLEEGEISGVVKSKSGFYIFILVKKNPESTLPLSEVEADIKAYRINQKMEKRFQEWVKELRDNAYIIIK